MDKGGLTAEELIYGEDNVTDGCSYDLKMATAAAKAIVKKLGIYVETFGNILQNITNPIGTIITIRKMND